MNDGTLTRGTAAPGKIRSAGAIVALNLITLGLYSVYWWWAINRELRDFGASRKTTALKVRPLVSAAAFLLGGCLIVPFVWTAITTNQRIEAARRMVRGINGRPAWVAPLLLCISILLLNVAGLMPDEVILFAGLLLAGWAAELAAIVRMQLTLNAVWRHEGAVPKPWGAPRHGAVDPTPRPISPPTMS